MILGTRHHYSLFRLNSFLASANGVWFLFGSRKNVMKAALALGVYVLCVTLYVALMFLMGCDSDPNYSQYCVDEHKEFTQFCMKYCHGGYVRLSGTTPMFFESETECQL